MTKTSSSRIKYFAYVRKSSETKERQALSVPAQIGDIQDRFHDCDIEFIFEEKSAFKPNNRPLFEEMLKRIRAGERTGLIAWHPDRLSRNEIDAGQITYMVRTEVIEDLKFVGSNFENTPEGIMALQFSLTQSQYESAKKSPAVQRGIRKKAEMGFPPGVSPLGFMNDPIGEKGFKELKVDPERFPLVKQLLRMMLTSGYPVTQLWRIARDELKLTTFPRKREGGRPVSRNHMYMMVRNPIYAGFFYHAGKRYELNKKLPRAISEDEYWQIQAMLGPAYGVPRPQKREGLYNLFMKDANGGSTTGDHKHQLICSKCKKKFSYNNRDRCPKCDLSIKKMKDPVRCHYVYYQSTRERKTPGVVARAVEEQTINKRLAGYFGDNLAMSKALSEWCIRNIGEIADKELEETRDRKQSRERAEREATRKLDALLDLRLQRLDMTPEDNERFDGKEAALKAELEALKGSESNETGSGWL